MTITNKQLSITLAKLFEEMWNDLRYHDPDSTYVWELVKKHGFAREVFYDQSKHGEDPTGACEPGDPWLELTELGTEALKDAKDS
jgi:hypothetical protein